jgi:hypothetical protein
MPIGFGHRRFSSQILAFWYRSRHLRRQGSCVTTTFRHKDGGKPQACGWLIDRYGARWQIVPAMVDELMTDADHRRTKRAPTQY